MVRRNITLADEGRLWEGDNEVREATLCPTCIFHSHEIIQRYRYVDVMVTLEGTQKNDKVNGSLVSILGGGPFGCDNPTCSTLTLLALCPDPFVEISANQQYHRASQTSTQCRI